MSGTMTNISTEHIKEIELTEKEPVKKIMGENILETETYVEKDQFNATEEIREKSNIEDIEHDSNAESNAIESNAIGSNAVESEEEGDDEEEGDGAEEGTHVTNEKIDNEDKEEGVEESYMEMSNKGTKCKEVHMLHDNSYTSRDDDDMNSGYGSMKPKKKKTKILLKAKIHSYFHKSYDKVSNAIMRTSKTFMRSGHTSDYRSDKISGVHNGSMFFTSNSDELLVNQNEFVLLEDELDMLKEYFDPKINIEKSNIEILNQFKSNLENNLPEQLINTLTDLLIERKLLIKSVNHFKKENETFKSCLEKYKNSYYILKTENEQLNENIKTLKSYIDNIQKYNENDISNVADKSTTTNDISMEPREETKELVL